MKKWINKYQNSDFLRDVATLMSGSGTAQIIPFIVSPFLTRLFQPQEFGLLALYMSIVGVLSVFSTARYELSIMLPEKDENALRIVIFAFSLLFIFSLVMLLSLLPLRFLIANFFDNNDLARWILIAPLSILFIGGNQVLNYWHNRKRRYKKLALARVLQAGTNALVAVFLGFFYPLKGALIISVVASHFVSFILLFWNLWKEISWSSIERKLILEEARKYLDFPTKSLPGAFFNIMSSQLPVILINNFFGAQVLGFYSLTMRVLNAPMSLVGVAISQVFYRKAVEHHRQEKLHALLKITSKNLLLIIFIPMLVLFVAGEGLFSLFFGKEWAFAGIIAQLMAPFYLVRFIFSSQSFVMATIGRIDFELKFNIVFFVSQVSAMLIGYYGFGNPKAAFSLMSATGAICFSYLGWFFFSSTKVMSNEKSA